MISIIIVNAIGFVIIVIVGISYIIIIIVIIIIIITEMEILGLLNHYYPLKRGYHRDL